MPHAPTCAPLFVTLVAVALASCAHSGGVPLSMPVAARGAPPLQGFWVSDGYGLQFEIADDVLQASEVSARSCLPGWRARRVGGDAEAPTYALVGDPVTILLRPDSSPDRIRVHLNGTASDISARRAPGKLPVCAQATPDTPIANFDVFATTWAENYPFFAEAKVDWAQVVASVRVKITPRTKPRELFDILQGMIAPLEDAHTFLSAPKLGGERRAFSGFHDRPGSLDPKGFDKAERVTNGYFPSPLQKFCEGQLELGMLGPDVAYLRIGSFAGFVPDDSFEKGLVVLEAAMDVIFHDTTRWKGLIIDVRINGGGADPYGLAIAGRLTGAEYVAYAKQARLPPGFAQEHALAVGSGRLDPADPSNWTTPQPSVVRPSPRPGFRGEVVELTGPNSISAAETFSQGLLERVPHVVRVGQSTQGVFSDVLERGLPNGWRFGLPNERFVTQGKSYDRTGIPPTVTVPLYAPADLVAGRDIALETAVQLIRSR
jgi:hypothetical protein